MEKYSEYIDFGLNLRVIKAKLSFEWGLLAQAIAESSAYYSSDDIDRLATQLSRWATQGILPHRWAVVVPAIAAGLTKLGGQSIQYWVNRLMAVETVSEPVEYDGLGGK